MIIRNANQEDIPDVVSFQLAMALETEQLVLNTETVGKGVAAVFKDPSRGSYYVAELEGKVIGSLLTTYEWSDWRNGTVLWIQSVYVLPQHRRKGVYRQLYAYLQQKVLADPNLRGIRLYADISNVSAHQTYKRLGMNADHYQTFEWMKKF